MNYLLHLIILFEIYLILALSLNLMVGYTGLVSLAHAAVYGIGAYVTSVLMVSFKMGFVLAVILAVVITAVFSLAVSFSSARFKGDYFVLATLAFQVIVFSILNNWVGVTRGTYGIPDIPKPIILGFEINSPQEFAILGFILAFLVTVFLSFVFTSPFGQHLKAIRDDETAAESLGIAAFPAKVKCVAIASCCAAVAGALFASYVSFIDPTSFTVDESIVMLSMVVVGGTGNLRGPIVGAFIIVFLPEILRLLDIPDSIASNINMIIYGIVLIIIMRFRPKGIAGTYAFK
jgi:branched-chain amino acid transport system permease protein